LRVEIVRSPRSRTSTNLDGEVGDGVKRVLPPAADSIVAVIHALHSGLARDGLYVIVHQGEKGA
jgi:hypothetical protein